MEGVGIAAATSSESPRDLVNTLAEQQALAAKIREQRRSMVMLDERRQKLREAARKLKTDRKKTWVCFGPTVFLRFPTETAVDLIEKDEKVIEESIKGTENDVKDAVDALMKLENQKGLEERGFRLKSVN